MSLGCGKFKLQDWGNTTLLLAGLMSGAHTSLRYDVTKPGPISAVPPNCS